MMKTRIRAIICAVLPALALMQACGKSGLPRVWSTYRTVESMEKDFADLKAHGVGLVSMSANSPEAAKKALDNGRRFGLKFHVNLPDITEQAQQVRDAGLEPVDALMIGGAYDGKAIDRHVFRFSPARHEIVIEPPVYNPGLPYTRGSGGTGKPKASEPIGHYWPDMPAPARAEIIVPLQKFDGKQHLKILPAAIAPAAANTKLAHDSVTPDLPQCEEIRNRKLYRLSFDLSGLGGAMLDHVGIAVYWPYRGSPQYWMFGRGTISAAAESTRAALRPMVRKALALWSDANGGRFPSDVIPVVRFGDECFYTTGHIHANSDAVSYPLWEFSEPSIQAFRAKSGGLEHPRTWGYPEIYGTDAYAWWQYRFHSNTAALVGIVRDEVDKIAPGTLMFRNTTRAGAFGLANDHDGSGPELLTRVLDIAHLDPYPVSGSGYSDVIPRDMSYYAGLARRYNRLLVPWMQAHTYAIGKNVLQHVTPEQVDRMAQEHLAHGPDAIVWLGYCPDCTFPNVQPASWARAGEFHKQMNAMTPKKPKAQLAALRSYRAWSLTNTSGGQIRNPGDWQLQQLLEVWAVKRGQAYDVFELPPALSEAEKTELGQKLKAYRYVVSNEPWTGAWVVGQGTEGQTVDPATAPEVRKKFEAELEARGWLAPAK